MTIGNFKLIIINLTNHLFTNKYNFRSENLNLYDYNVLYSTIHCILMNQGAALMTKTTNHRKRNLIKPSKHQI